MSAFIKSHRLRLLATVSCPVLAIVGAICVTIGVLAELPFMVRLGETAFSFAMILLLPLGIANAFLSWQMARTKLEAVSDSQDVVEFLLGFAGFVMIVLGTILSPVTFWLAVHLCFSMQ